MFLVFREPVWLLLILLALPLAWLGLRWFRSMSRARAISAVVARSALIAMIAMMLAGAATVQRTDRLAVIAVIDVSGSVQRFADFGTDASGRRIPAAEAMRDWLERAAEARSPNDLLGVVLFDGEAMAIAAPAPPGAKTGADGAGGWRIADLPLDLSFAEGTDIAEALRFAAALFPPDARKRILLISDGNATSGDAMGAAGEIISAAGEGERARVPIDALPIAYNVQNETLVEFVDAPPQATRESLITVRVGLFATRPTSGTLRLLREGVELDINGGAPGAGRRVSLEPGRQVIPIEVRTPPETVHRFRAIFEPDDPATDAVVQNNSGEAFTITPGKGRILIVDGVSGGADRGPGAILPSTLRRAGLDVETIPGGALPTDLLSLQEYDLIMLQNVPAEQVARGGQSILASYVRDMGGGLVMIGGPDSFGAGGWNGGEVEDVLPVEMDLPEDLIIPSAAIVIVLDSSGSMNNRVLGGMRSQQEIANEAAALAIQTLDPQDLVGVVEFSNIHRVVVPLGPNENPDATAERVRAISSDGGTNMYPALAEAGAMLRDVEAQVKLVILLSDGQSMGSPEYGENLAQRLAAENVKVTTIAVGDGADAQTLASIAQAGNGQFYEVVDPNLLPQIFIREVRVVRKPMIRESPFQPRLTPTGSPITAGLPTNLPPLAGFVLTQPRPEAIAIDAMLAPTGEPVLSHWNIGLGQAAAWTSDASVWARAWVESPVYETLWTQLARTISRPATSQQYEVVTEARDGTLRIRLDAADEAGDPLDLLTVPGTIYTPSGRKREITLTQTGPGVYEAEVEANETGAYVTALTPRLGERRLPPVIAGAASATSPEYARLESNVGLLRQLAEVTGGRALSWESPENAALFDRAELAPTRALSPLWPTLLVWTVAILLLDVGTRRIAWDRLLSKELGAAIREQALQASQARGEQATATLGRLRGKARPGRAADDAPAMRQQAPPPRRLSKVKEAPDDADRRKSIREALRASQGKGQTARYSEPERKKSPQPGADEAGAADLLAAKRRARERYSPGEDAS